MMEKRIRTLQEGPAITGPVIYWMSRDQRLNDNWALLYAQKKALEMKSPLLVVFCLVPQFLGASQRQYGFMLKGLKELEVDLYEKNIPFHFLLGTPEKEIPAFAGQNKAAVLITDFDPLKIKRQWKEETSSAIKIPFYEIDTHNIVPCWEASVKQEYGAYTIRPKIHRILNIYLKDFSKIVRHPFSLKRRMPRTQNQKIIAALKINKDVAEIDWLRPGEKAAQNILRRFIKQRLEKYPVARNDPNQQGQSDLSPYLHFGQVAAQRIALEVLKSDAGGASQESFLEELIVRRELSDNFCFYNSNYDNPAGLPKWAQETLDIHKNDKREYLYSLKQFEQAQTHDPLWNAAQNEMVMTGKMHGYLRMYWAKKILEWTSSPAQAFAFAIYLNDKYELDGRDPNGYAGIAWSIGGMHDRAWGERAVFGKIRYMSFKGSKTKFDVQRYIDKVGQT